MATTILQLQEPRKDQRFALFELGFRPFFLLASLYAAISASLWMAVYFQQAPLVPHGLTPSYWHAHEMIFGFAFAVVAGFLLTVVQNWTNIQTIRHWRLALLAAFWLAARLLFLLQAPWQLTLACELAFATGLLAAASCPLYQARQWRNLTIFASKVLFLGLGNLAFYLGMAGILEDGMRWGLYTGLYILIALIFTMGRRVIPFFIEKGIGYPVQVRNSKIVDLTSMGGLLALWFAELLAPASPWTIGFALVTASAQVIRLYWWHQKGIWSKPLLWVLWVGLALVTMGLLLKALAEGQGMQPFAAWHAMAYGGVGLVTMGMMARATLGHTGRSVFNPPAIIGPLFVGLLLGALIRSLGPLLIPGQYLVVIGLSQLIWILAFSLFFLTLLPMWIGPSR